MPAATKAQYRKAARLYHSGKYSQVQALLKSGVYTSEKAAIANGYSVFDRENGNKIVCEELERLEAIEFDESVMSKKEKLQQNAALSRALFDRVAGQLERGEEEIDHKALDNFNKIGKRDDSLQGHQIQAETNPQDKIDAMIADIFIEIQKENADRRMKDADIVDV